MPFLNPLTCSRHRTLQIFEFQFSKSLFLLLKGGKKTFLLLAENIFWTNNKMFSCPPTKTKIWRIGIRIFGGSDVVNKLLDVMTKILGWKFIIIFNWERKNLVWTDKKVVYLTFIGQKISYFRHYVYVRKLPDKM